MFMVAQTGLIKFLKDMLLHNVFNKITTFLPIYVDQKYYLKLF